MSAESYPFVFAPSLPRGAVGASQSASVNSASSPLKITPTKVLLHSFFVDYLNERSVLDAAKLIVISKPCKAVLSLDVKEKDLRNAVFNDLLKSNSGLQFPPNAQGKYVIKNKTKFFYYKEETIAAVLPQISSLIVPNSHESKMKKLENGLLVTSASTPDMIVLNPLRTRQLYEMVQGEFKHGTARSEERRVGKEC